MGFFYTTAPHPDSTRRRYVGSLMVGWLDGCLFAEAPNDADPKEDTGEISQLSRRI